MKMKIQSNPVIQQNDAKKVIQGEVKLLKGQVFSGRVVSSEGDIYNIRTSTGGNLKAYGSGKLELPVNTQLVFEVLDSSRDMIVIRPVQGNQAGYVSGTEMLVGLLESLGIEPLPENISFLKDGGYAFGRNIEKLMKVISQEKGQDEAAGLKSIMIKPGALADYIKSFEGEEKFLNLLEALVRSAGGDGTSSRLSGNLSAGLLKGLTIQINHDYPLFLIPVPLYFEDKPCHGEIWIEDEGAGNHEAESLFSIHILIDTPSFGRIEGDIKSSGMAMNLDIYCGKEVIPLFQRYAGDLEDRISELGLKLTGFGVFELKRSRGFMDFVQKYVRPFTPIDVRV